MTDDDPTAKVSKLSCGLVILSMFSHFISQRAPFPAPPSSAPGTRQAGPVVARAVSIPNLASALLPVTSVLVYGGHQSHHDLRVLVRPTMLEVRRILPNIPIPKPSRAMASSISKQSTKVQKAPGQTVHLGLKVGRSCGLSPLKIESTQVQTAKSLGAFPGP